MVLGSTDPFNLLLVNCGIYFCFWRGCIYAFTSSLCGCTIMSEVAIKVENLTKVYRLYDDPIDRLKESLHPFRKKYHNEFYALNDVKFEIEKGETVGIIGKNGSGKSTLLQIISGVLTPTKGTVTANGKIAALLELGTGFNVELSGIENVYFNGALMGFTREEIDEKLDCIVSFADIGEFVYQPVKTYSSGMMVRLAFAVIAHINADILVVDEALAVGDAFFTQKCMRFLRNFMKRGTVIFVSHDTSAVVNLCSRAILLQQGTVKISGSPKSVTEHYLAKQYEAIQGDIDSAINKPTDIPISDSKEFFDMRRDFINMTSLRNDIEVFKFEYNSECKESFGMGGANIEIVQLLDQNDKPLSWVVGGERVKLLVQCKVNTVLEDPIVGFLFKDRLGQDLFGDNTYITYSEAKLSASPGQLIAATFEFRMPILLAGDYSITIAIAQGTQKNHKQHHWIHDALILKSHSSSVCTGLVGVPMININMMIR